MNDIISIIVPIYNSEKYLPECIKSILNQTYKNIEIILINDGSTDNSLKICKNYSKIDNRIKKLDKLNSGVAESRNKGIQIASGQFIMFVDSDDFLETTIIEKLYNSIKLNNSDLAICKINDYVNDNKIKRYENNLNSIVFTKKSKSDFIKNYFAKNEADSNNIMGVCFRMLIKKDILTNNNITFPKLKQLEDLVFCTELITKINKISVVNEYLYNYRYVEASAIHKFNIKMINERIKYLYCLSRIFENTNSILKTYKNVCLQRTGRSVVLFCFMTVMESDLTYHEKKEKLNLIRKDSEIKKYNKLRFITNKNNILLNLFKLRLYYIYEIYHKFKNR